ncbi:MAG: tetratricopeptide repeat protein [Verrucomicrobia bacterium]|nr:tetratricopeptide repeat protein [Verrucomicrobiota bacterium]
MLLLTGCTPPGPRALLEGEGLLQRGQYAQAVEKLQTAVNLLPQNAQAWNHLGLALHGAGRHDEAVRAYRQALAPGRNLPVAHFNLGCLLLERQDYAGAAEELRAFTVLQPRQLAAWLKLGTAQLRLRQFDLAEKSFRQALALDAKNAEATTSLGLVQVYRGKPAEAAGFFIAALQAQPNHPPALFNLAVVSQFYLPQRPVDRRPFALQKYREYLALQPPPPNRAQVEELARRLEAELNPPKPPVTNAVTQAVAPTNLPVVAGVPATRAATNALPRNPGVSNTPPVTAQKSAVKTPDKLLAAPTPPASNPPPLMTNLARLEAPSNRVTPVETDAAAKTNTVAGDKPEKGSFLDRINPVNLFRRTPKPDVLFNAGTNTVTDAPAATPAPPAVSAPETPPGSSSRRYAYLSPPVPAAGNQPAALAPFDRGLKAHRQGKLTEAVAAYQAALKSNPAFFEANYNLGLALHEQDDVPAALSALETALAIDEKSADARYSFSQALRKGGYHLDAANELERLLAERPEETRAHLALANLYVEQLSLRALAREHYLKVLELEPRHPKATDIRFWLKANQ